MRPDEVEKEVSLSIKDDGIPESDETIFVYLTEPTGGARIAEGATDGGKFGFAQTEIIRSDDWNGLIGFSDQSQNVSIDEDHGASVSLWLMRINHADFTYDTSVQWELVFSAQPELADNFVESSGLIVCPSLQSTCELKLRLIDDLIPEFGFSFPVRLFNPSSGAKIDPQRTVATVTVLPSDSPYGVIEFASEYVVVARGSTEAVLSVNRRQGLNYRVSVSYGTERVYTEGMFLAGIRVYSAVHGADYNQTSGTLEFPDMGDNREIRVTLTPNRASSANYPKTFKVIISNSQFGAILGARTECTVVIVQTADLPIWDTQVALATTDNMDDETIAYLVTDLTSQDFSRLTPETLSVLEHIIKRIVSTAEERPLTSSIRKQLIAMFCDLMSQKVKATEGRYSLVGLYERFIFSLLIGEPCESQKDPYPLVTCQHSKFSVAKLYSHNMNGYQYSSSSRDSLRIGAAVLSQSDNNSCHYGQFIEYNHPQWFRKSEGVSLLSGRVLAASLRLPSFTDFSPASGENSLVTYKIYTQDGRRTDKRARCVYYDEGSHVWTAGNNVCRVKNELQLGTSDYVECECHHMSSYGVISLTRDADKIGYPPWMFIIAGITMVSLLIREWLVLATAH